MGVNVVYISYTGVCCAPPAIEIYENSIVIYGSLNINCSYVNQMKQNRIYRFVSGKEISGEPWHQSFGPRYIRVPSAYLHDAGSESCFLQLQITFQSHPRDSIISQAHWCDFQTSNTSFCLNCVK